MRRIFLVVGVAMVIATWLALPAVAESQPLACAPAAESASNKQPGNAGPAEQKAELPSNRGTQRAADKSPAVNNGFCARI
jgi:hypothetical protein